jgi:hypothetical protein
MSIAQLSTRSLSSLKLGAVTMRIAASRCAINLYRQGCEGRIGGRASDRAAWGSVWLKLWQEGRVR